MPRNPSPRSVAKAKPVKAWAFKSRRGIISVWYIRPWKGGVKQSYEFSHKSVELYGSIIPVLITEILPPSSRKTRGKLK